MGVVMEVSMTGLECQVAHEPSGSMIRTTPPKDNGGDGSSFSPTDLLAAALASCAVTTIALQVVKEGFTVAKAHARVEKEMVGPPRRVGALAVVITLPASLSPSQRLRVEEIAKQCPVARSLHPDVQMPMRFVYL